MEVGKLTVQLREGTGKGVSRKLRRAGLVPGICYGVGLDKPVDITLDPKALKASLDPELGQNTVIDLTVTDNGAEKHRVIAMLWEYQVHPIKRTVLHVDMVAIDPDKEVEVEVPIKYVGKAKGTIEGGVIHVVLREISVRARPANIPKSFVVDITDLDVGDNLHISDVPMPEGVEPAVSTSLTLVACQAPRAEVEAAPEEGVEAVEGEAPAAAEKAEGEAGGEKSE